MYCVKNKCPDRHNPILKRFSFHVLNRSEKKIRIRLKKKKKNLISNKIVKKQLFL